jgi:cytochrome c553
MEKKMKKILLGSMVAVLIFSGCTEDSKKTDKVENTSTQTTTTQSNKNIEIIKEKSNDIINSSKEIVNAVKEETLKAVDNSKEIAKDVVEKTKEVSVDVAKEAKVITNSVAENITQSIDKVIDTKNNSTDNAKALFLKCAGCHGQNGEIHALGKSQKISEWDAVKIENALLGYKNGTYGGNMKGVMIGQVMQLSESDIKSLSTYISKMGK